MLRVRDVSIISRATNFLRPQNFVFSPFSKFCTQNGGKHSSESEEDPENPDKNENKIPVEKVEEVYTKLRKTGRDFAKRDVDSAMNRAAQYKEKRRDETPEETNAREQKTKKLKEFFNFLQNFGDS